MTFINTTLPNNFDAQSNGRSTSNPFVDAFQSHDPTSSDIQYPIQKKWLNTATGAFWELQNFNTTSGITTANWVLIGHHAAVVETLTGNDGIVVPPTGNNINVLGDVTNITTSGNAGTSTLTVSLNGNSATSYVCDTGSATPSSHILNVLGTDGVTTVGSGNTITVELVGGGNAIEKIAVDTFTGPGTNPVLPNAGQITVTGGQVAAGTTTNVIQTDSLAANTYTVQVQRSQAVASTTIGDNGVCHFDNSKFSVDSNGFVSLASTFYNQYTFTPVLNIGGSPTGITYSQQLAQVTIIGNIAIISIGIALTSKGANTGALTITGNPVACEGTFGDNILLNFTPSNVPAGTFQALGEILPSQTLISLFITSNGTGTTAVTDAMIANNTSMQINGTYFLT